MKSSSIKRFVTIVMIIALSFSSFGCASSGHSIGKRFDKKTSEKNDLNIDNLKLNTRIVVTLKSGEVINAKFLGLSDDGSLRLHSRFHILLSLGYTTEESSWIWNIPQKDIESIKMGITNTNLVINTILCLSGIVLLSCTVGLLIQ